MFYKCRSLRGLINFFILNTGHLSNESDIDSAVTCKLTLGVESVDEGM